MMRIDYFPHDANNPYTDLIYDPLTAAGHSVRAWTPTSPRRQVDAFHLHWIEMIVRGRFARRSRLVRRMLVWRLTRALRRVRGAGGRVVWTVHNLRPHDEPDGRGPKSTAIAAVLPYVDRAIALSHDAATQIAALYPGFSGRISVIPHPAYTTYPPGARARARTAHGIPEEAVVIGVFGLIRAYKRIEDVIAAVAAMGDSGVWLLVGGECHEPDLAARIEAGMAALPRARLLLRRLDDQDFADGYAASDLVICAQQTFLNSGSVMAALSLGCRVLARPVGSLPEIARAVGEDWLVLRGAIDAASIAEALALPRHGLGPDLTAFSARTVSDQHLALYAAPRWPA